MIIEVGKRYIRRDGMVTAPLVTTTGKLGFPLMDPEEGLTYTYEGKWGEVDHAFDLVSSYKEETVKDAIKPKTDLVSPGLDQIPLEGLQALGRIFDEGEKKYGRDNWKNLNKAEEYDKERTRHAIEHLFKYANGDRTEDHLAKIAWFAVTSIWRRENE